jgi:hypothetical protein
MDNIYTPQQFYELQKQRGYILFYIGKLIYNILLKSYIPLFYYNICPYFIIGTGNSGFSFGWFFICGSRASDDIKNHEVGHGLQNIEFGAFKMFALWCGSIVRFWWRKIIHSSSSYYQWWFERDASKRGAAYVKSIKI